MGNPLNLFRIAVLSVTLALLSGCSLFGTSDGEPVVDPLADWVPQHKIKKVWRTSVGKGADEQYLKLQLAGDEQQIFAASANGKVCAYDSGSGKRAWCSKLDLPISAGLGADTQQLYLVSIDGEVIALDRSSGEERWRVNISSEALAAPSSNGALVMVQSVDDQLFALAFKDGSEQWVVERSQPTLSLRGTAAPVIAGQLTLTGFANGELVALDNRDGGVVWAEKVGLPQGKTELERLVDVDGSVAVEGREVYAVGFQGKLMAIDLQSGRSRWSREMSSLASPVVDRNHVYVATAEGRMVAIDRQTNELIWQQDRLQQKELTSPVIMDDWVAVGDTDGFVSLVSRIDGSLLAHQKLTGDPLRSQLLVAGDLFYALDADAVLTAFRIQ